MPVHVGIDISSLVYRRGVSRYTSNLIAGLLDDTSAHVSVYGSSQIGRAHVCTPVTNAHLVCRLLLEKKQNKTDNEISVTNESKKIKNNNHIIKKIITITH